MRQLVIIFFLGSAFCYNLNRQQLSAYASVEPYIFEDLINSTIEGLRVDIPDIVEVDDLDIELPDEEDAIIKGDAKISHLKLSGLHDFQVSALQFNLLGFQLDFTLKLPLIDFYTDFDADLTLADIPIYGDGNATVHVTDLEIQASAVLNLTGGITVRDLDLQLYVGGANFELHGIFNDEEISALLSSLLNDLPTIIDENQELVTELISPVVEIIINMVLGGLLDTTPAPQLDAAG